MSKSGIDTEYSIYGVLSVIHSFVHISVEPPMEPKLPACLSTDQLPFACTQRVLNSNVTSSHFHSCNWTYQWIEFQRFSRIHQWDVKWVASHNCLLSNSEQPPLSYQMLPEVSWLAKGKAMCSQVFWIYFTGAPECLKCCGTEYKNILNCV